MGGGFLKQEKIENYSVCVSSNVQKFVTEYLFSSSMIRLLVAGPDDG